MILYDVQSWLDLVVAGSNKTRQTKIKKESVRQASSMHTYINKYIFMCMYISYVQCTCMYMYIHTYIIMHNIFIYITYMYNI
jgi:hypothetical protein